MRLAVVEENVGLCRRILDVVRATGGEIPMSVRRCVACRVGGEGWHHRYRYNTKYITYLWMAPSVAE